MYFRMSNTYDEFFEYSHNMSHVAMKDSSSSIDEDSSSSIDEMISLPCSIQRALYNKTMNCKVGCLRN